MSGYELYREGCAVRDKLEAMRLADLLALNPTLQDMRHILEVMAIGHGKGADEWHVQQVQKLLGTSKKETCRCKKDEGLRSTHCSFHGTCNCCHGCTCPQHDEPERFVPVEQGFCW